MFNRSAFNDLRYNQPYPQVTLSAELSATTTLIARTTASVTSHAHLSAKGDIVARPLIVQSFRAVISAKGSTRATILRMIAYRSNLSGISRLHANARRYQIRTLKYTGSFTSGQVILIRTRQMSIALDGQDATHLMQGQFGRLGSGVNEVVYRDAAAQRSVLLQVEHKDTSL